MQEINQTALNENLVRANILNEVLPSGWCYSIEVTEYKIILTGNPTPSIVASLTELGYEKDEDPDMMSFENDKILIRLMK